MDYHPKLLKLFSPLKEVFFQSPEILIRPGDSPRYLYYIKQGQVRQYDITNRGEELVVSTYSKGSALPIEWLTEQTPSLFFYETSKMTILYQAPFQKVTQAIKQNAELAFELLRYTNTALEESRYRLAQLILGDAKEKVLFELVQLCESHGEKQGEQTYFIPFHENDIAQRIGLTRETVNRTMKLIDHGRVIKVEHAGIYVLDYAYLKSFVDR